MSGHETADPGIGSLHQDYVLDTFLRCILVKAWILAAAMQAMKRRVKWIATGVLFGAAIGVIFIPNFGIASGRGGISVLAWVAGAVSGGFIGLYLSAEFRGR